MLIHLCRDGQTHGPYSPEQFEEMLCSCQVEKTDNVWIQCDGWEPLSAFERCFGPHEQPALQTQRLVTPVTGLSSSGAEVRLTGRSTKPMVQEEDEPAENLLRTALGV